MKNNLLYLSSGVILCFIVLSIIILQRNNIGVSAVQTQLISPIPKNAISLSPVPTH